MAIRSSYQQLKFAIIKAYDNMTNKLKEENKYLRNKCSTTMRKYGRSLIHAGNLINWLIVGLKLKELAVGNMLKKKSKKNKGKGMVSE